MGDNMKGITFGSFHSYDDLHLILTSKEMGSPAVKVKKIDVEGADSALDLTDYFGEPKYEDVTHRFDFSTIVPQSQFLSLYSTIKNAIHGKKLRIILDDDPLFYYVGRIHVSQFTNEKGIGTISVEADCEPWKYKKVKTETLQSLSGKNLFDYKKQPFSIYQTKVEVIQSGIRLESLTSGLWRFTAFSIAPLNLLVGKTISFKCNTNVSTGATKRIALGCYNASSSEFQHYAFASIQTNIAILHITKVMTDKYTHLGLWLYSSADVAGPVGSFVEYTNIQMEIGNSPTEYEPYNSEEHLTEITLSNSRKHVVPEIFASKAINITKGGYTAALQAERTYQIPEFELSEGDNEFNVTGTGGLISFTYQEAGL